MKALANKWSVEYLARNDHKGAKAGNLNYALQHSQGDFIVTMDADMKMKPTFLNEVMPQFKNEDMGFVQTPQAFHNDDVFQHNLYVEDKVRNDQDFFMRFLQVQKNRFNAVIYVGSNAVFRRKALDSVGGFVTDVITEDMATGLLVQNEGWKSEFINKVLATGLAPESFSELIKQRVRWARGNIQVFKKYSPWSLKNLSATQKLLYVDGVHYWFFGIYHFLYLMFPIVSILFNVQIINASSVYFIPIWLVSYILSNLVFSSVSGRDFRPMWASVGELAIFPYITKAILEEIFFNKESSFEVTQKGEVLDQETYNWSLMKVQLIFLTLSILSLAVLTKSVFNNPIELLTYWTLPLFWLIYNIISLIGALHISIDRPRYRHQFMKTKDDGDLIINNTKVAGTILKVHPQKVVFKINDKNIENIENLSAGELVINQKLSLPVKLIKTNYHYDDLYISLAIEPVDTSTFMKFYQYLDHLNTLRFENRVTNYKFPSYYFTIGYYKNRHRTKKEVKF